MKTIKTKIQAVIFDLDGTILKTEHLWEKATRKFLADKGFTKLNSKQEELLKSFSGTSVEFAVKQIKKEFNLSDTDSEITRIKQDLVVSYFKNGLEFIKGFEQFHKQLRDNAIPSSIATNCDDESLAHLIKQMKLNSFFDHIYNISDVNNKSKPNPHLFLHAAKKLSVEPHKCIIFEDSLSGFTAAKAAGIRCVAIKNETNKDHLHLADVVINDYDEALDAIKKLLK